MSLVLKTILYKKWHMMLMLVLLSFVMMLSLQITVTLYSKNTSLAQRVDRVNGAHTNIYQTFHAQFDIQSVIQDLGTYETTYAIGFHRGDKEQDIFLEGYVSRQTNLFAVLEGKALTELGSYEIAVTESYARSLTKSGINPIGYQLTFDQQVFTVVSIVDYPNYNDGYLGKNRLQDIQLFNYPLLSVALGNYDTIKQMAEANRDNFSHRLVYKVHLQTYSERAEHLMRYRVARFNDGYDTYQIDVSSLIEVSQLASVSDLLFQFLSVIVLAGFMISSTYLFYLFLRKQLMQDTKTIGVLVLQGIEHQRLIRGYLLQLAGIILGALAFFAVFQFWLVQLLRGNRGYAAVIDSNQIILVRTLLLYGGYMIVVAGLFMMQLRRYMHKAFLMTKTADQHYFKQSLLKSSWFSVQLAWKTIIADPLHTLGAVLSIALLIVTLGITLFAGSTIKHIYGPKTLGVTFDYIVGRVKFDQYHEAKNYTQKQVWLRKYSNIYFVDVDYDTNFRTYYKSNLLMFYNTLDGFVPVVGGKATFLTEEQKSRIYRAFYLFTAASRRHVDARGLSVYHVNDVDVPIEKQFLFYRLPGFRGDYEATAQIDATVNTLIDNGWIAYAMSYHSEQPSDNVGSYVEMFMANVASPEQGKEFEAYLQKQGISYMTFAQVLDILNEINQEVNQRTVFMIELVAALLVVLLLINMAMSLQCRLLQQKNSYQFLGYIGVAKQEIYKTILLQEWMILAGGMIIGGSSFLGVLPLVREGLLKAYGLYAMEEWSSAIYFIYGSVVAGILAGMFAQRKANRRLYQN